VGDFRVGDFRVGDFRPDMPLPIYESGPSDPTFNDPDVHIPQRTKGNRKNSFSLLRPFSYLRPLYIDSLTSTSVLRHFVKSGLLIGRKVQVEVKFWSKSSLAKKVEG